MLILIFLRNLFTTNKCAILPKGLKNFLQANVKIENRMRSQSVARKPDLQPCTSRA